MEQNVILKDRKTPTIEIYDPPMCCPEGLCGPVVDPVLLGISEAIISLRKEYGEEITVARYILSQQGQKFMQNPEILSLLKEKGANILPVTVVNGKIKKTSKYPSYEELKLYLGA
jgi:hypothetical protein